MKLHFQRSGQGNPLVILHGLFGTLENWGAQVKLLTEHFDVIAVDLRNHGRSPHSAEMSYPLMAADVLELLDDLGLDRVDMIGIPWEARSRCNWRCTSQSDSIN